MNNPIAAWDRLPLEQQLVGLVMNNPEMIHKLLDAGICDEYFYDPFALLVFKAMLECKFNGMSIDERNIASLLGEKHQLALLELDLNAPISVNLEYFLQPFLEQHAAKVVETNNANNRHLSTMELQKLNTAMVQDIMGGLQKQRDLFDVTKDWEQRADDFLSGKTVFLPTHIDALNDAIDGWRPGGLYILGARPKVGKTTLAINFAHHLAVNHNARVIYASVEQSDVEVVDKFIALQSRAPTWKIARRQSTEQELDRIHKAKNQLRQTKLQLWGDWRGQWDILLPRLESAFREKHKPEFIVIDHLHIMKTDSKSPPSSLEGLTRMTGEAKVFAQTYNVPVLMCSQFNRESDKEDRAPRLSDLRGSGSIEQDADVVMFVHRPSKDIRDPKRDLIVAANRHGDSTVIKLTCSFAISEMKGEEF